MIDEKELIGKKFNSLTIKERVYETKSGKKTNKRYFRCVCDCGNETIVFLHDLKSGGTKTCGCSKVKKFKTHGMSDTRIYGIWTDMKQRCLNKNSVAYKWYGGCGVTICDEWKNDFMNFYNWAINNGYKEDLTLDRIDSKGNYEPENCRWADSYTQLNNTSRNHYVTIDGETRTISQWARFIGCKPMAIHRRIMKGISDVDAVISLKEEYGV